MWEIEVGRDPASRVPISAKIIPLPENHVNAGIAPILKNRVNVETVHIHTDMPTEVRIPQRSDNPTTLLWML